jgi:hypothetical protein
MRRFALLSEDEASAQLPLGNKSAAMEEIQHYNHNF